jgi:hypothetical protein
MATTSAFLCMTRFLQRADGRNPSLAEYENIEKNMPTILHHSCEFGHVSDDIYDKLGIIRDHDKMSREVTRDASISQESFH